MNKIENYLEGVKTVGITGHRRPDGDCIGSCLGLYNYLTKNYPELSVSLYLESIADKFVFLKNSDKIIFNTEKDEEFDLFIVLDSSDLERIGETVKYFDKAKKTLCIDHHISNNNFAMENVVDAKLSSASELLYMMLDEDKVDKYVAEALYLGIVHDSGVFKYSNTSYNTMAIAGKLMEKGIDFTSIIDDTFYTKTYVQNQILGRALLESVVFYDGKCIFSVVKKDEFDFYNITSADLDGVVEQLRITKGVEVAIFMYETEPMEYKISLRSKSEVDVSKVAEYFGGGGHIRAAGVMMHGTVYDVINNLSEQISLQLG
ncbi:phosphoesterase RecJ domain-containing protein [Lachnospiraceae bacterium RM5]|nr:phosphoesterase RecJ domain-containing protein [Lachnospiraceae bacterium RM5]